MIGLGSVFSQKVGVAPPVQPLLLDAYPGAAVAYSLRKLRTGVTNVVRVRRSNGDLEQDFSAVEILNGTLESWVGAGNNGFVTRWYDQSLNGNNLNQNVTANQFALVVNGALNLINGKPSASATLLTGLTRGPYFLNTRVNVARSFFTVAKINTISSVNYLCFQENGGVAFQTGGIFQAGSFLNLNGMGGFDNVNIRSITGEDLNQTLGYVNLKDNSLFAAKNGSAAVNAGSFVTELTIYTVFGRNADFGAFRGEAQEYIAYPFEQSGNKVAIEANINAYYNVY